MNPTPSPYPPVKIVVSGPVGAGKTTFIGTLSEIDVVSTDETASEEIGKQMTTVALDFGSLRVGDFDIFLFGTPGQERFSFMWEVLCEGALGLLLLVAGDRPSDFPHARRILDFITSQVAIPYVIGVTRQDMPRVWGPEDISDYFQVHESLVVSLDGRDPEGCRATLYHLFGVINTHVAQDASTAASSDDPSMYQNTTT